MWYTTIKRTSLMILTIVLFASLLSCSEDSTSTNTNTDNDLDNPNLTVNEQSDLLQLREEEKLARDVYTYAYEKWNKPIFQNISNSEQRHMDEVLLIMDKYELNDPILSEIGKFKDAHLQDLYHVLTEQCDISELEALFVGATIEDLDIYDLNQFITRTEKEDILDMYNLLNCGSRKHMRAFTKSIIREDTTYTTQFISQEEYNEILENDDENCN